MPKELFGADHAFLERSALLSFEEIERVARAFVALGVKKLRLTGGEPLVRRELESLIARLAAIDGVEDISLTTNGSLLTQAKARSLADAGLNRITVSLDAIDNATFAAINDVKFPVERVLSAIDAAVAVGLGPVKVNMVVARGMNEDQILPMARQFRHTPVILRFIEYMDVGNTNGWKLDQVISAADIVDTINAEFPLLAQTAQYRGEVASRWQYADGGGEIGVISSVTAPFCGTCTRVRLSAEGQIYTCLFASTGHDVRSLLRDGKLSDQQLEAVFAQTWRRRNDRYSEVRSSQTVGLPKIEMSYIGG
jgi:cyclic pyranopterin phosphate synthase